MTTIRPGARRDTFQARCLGAMDREILDCLCDRVVIDGKQVCVIFDHEEYKFEDGSVAVSSSVIEIRYMICDAPNAKRGSVVVRDGRTFYFKTQPRDQYDGWAMVQLTSDCNGCK